MDQGSIPDAEGEPVRGRDCSLQPARIGGAVQCGLTGEWQGSGAAAAAGNLRLPTIRAPSTFQYPPT